MTKPRKRHKLKPYSGPTEGRTVFDLSYAGPWMSNTFDNDYECAHCDQVLVEGMDDMASITNIIIICGKCRKMSLVNIQPRTR
jgi:hypothetical protein